MKIGFCGFLLSLSFASTGFADIENCARTQMSIYHLNYGDAINMCQAGPCVVAQMNVYKIEFEQAVKMCANPCVLARMNVYKENFEESLSVCNGN